MVQGDDVFHPEFLANIVLVGDSSGTAGTVQNVRSLANSWESNILSLKSQSDHMMLPIPGPHLIANGSLWQVSRLYDDVQGAFMVAVEPPVTKEYGYSMSKYNLAFTDNE